MTNAKLKRIYEIIPATLVWVSFLLAIGLSFVRPTWVIIFIIAFDLLWLFRIAHFCLLLAVSWRSYKKDQGVDWLQTLQEKYPTWSEFYHYVIFPTAGESFEVLDTTMQSLVHSKYPLDKFIVHIAGEERCSETFLPNVEKLKAKYDSTFFKLIFTVHPDGLEGEMRGKGANAHYAGIEGRKIIDSLGIPYEKILCSYFDSDTCAHEQYFAYLTYKFLTTPDPLHKAYQPAVLYNNNIWESPAIARIAAFGTVFWLMAEMVRPERMLTFSSHSIPYKALVDFDFWQKDIVTDDSRVFLQGFFHYHGNFRVVPMYIPVSMDNVMAGSWWQSAKNLYKQQRRWAWGAEHFPYVMQKFREYQDIPWIVKFKYIANQMEGMYSLATAPILIFILGRLPLYIASLGASSSSVIVQNTPYVLEKLMTISMVGIFVSAFMSFWVLPPRPAKNNRFKWLVMVLQWILVPLTMIFFGSIPAIDAQTRLALGKKYHLGFFVTPKHRIN